mgnify:CR=1 FL=1
MASRRLGAAVALVAAVAVAAGLAMWWRSDPGAPASMPVASVQGVQIDRSAGADPGLADAVRRSVTLVDASGCGQARQATATLVDADGGPTALTNQHVVAGAVDAEFTDGSGRPRSLDVTERVAARDAVHLDAAPLEDAGVEPLPVGPRPIVGSRVMVAGFPGGAFQAHVGRIERVERRHGYGGTVDMLIVDVEAIPGISGGVVVDLQGRAVGLVAARDPETGDTVAYPLDTLAGATTGASRRCGEE